MTGKVRGMRHDSKAGVGTDAFLGVGLYSVSESARVIHERLKREIERHAGKVDSKRLIRWAHGRHELTREYAPIILGPRKVSGSPVFTFTDLIELMTVAAFRARGVSSRAIRSAYERGLEKYGERPFARERYRTDGVGVFTKSGDPESEELSKQQTFFEELVKPILMDVSYLDGKAVRFSPLGTERAVILDPAIAFGEPVDKATGVPTSTLYAMKEYGESAESIADWYEVSVGAVRDAIEYEDSLRKAAA
jgi:uncharacterized protein (DUF433 family)